MRGGRQLSCNILSCLEASLNLHRLSTGLALFRWALPAGDLSGGLPGSNVTRDDLPDGPKPGEALKNLPKGSAGSQVSSQVCWLGCQTVGCISSCIACQP